jgi:diadenosine tetraphosphate (Ap4A) HIT family hydrolase
MTAIHRLVAACRSGAEPALIARMSSGWAVMGERQVLAGYSILLPDPVVPHLNALDAAGRGRFMTDLGLLGEAVLVAVGALRINYAIFGNLAPALHAHVHPRFVDEPLQMRERNPWAYDWEQAPSWTEAEHGDLRNRIRTHLARLS